MPSSESPSRLRQRLTWIIAAVVLLGAVVAWRMSDAEPRPQTAEGNAR